MSNITRSQRESRAFGLTVATGGFAVATVVLLVLAIFGVGSLGLVILCALVTAALFLWLRRTLKL